MKISNQIRKVIEDNKNIQSDIKELLEQAWRKQIQWELVIEEGMKTITTVKD